MDFYAVLDQVLDLLRRRGRVAYRALQVQFHLDDDALAALKDELIAAQRLAVDEAGTMLVWTGNPAPDSLAAAPPVVPDRPPLAYTPDTSCREDPHCQERSGRRAQAGHRAVRRPEGLHGAPGRP